MDANLFRVQHLSAMLEHDDIRAELIRQIDGKRVKQIEVARALNIAPARVAEIRKGERRIQQKEMPALARFLEMLPEENDVQSVARVARVPYLGKVAQGVWLEETYRDPDEQEFVDYDMEPGDPGPTDLFAVEPVGESMNIVFPLPLRLICQRIPFSSAFYKNGDLVIVEREAHDLREMTCKRLVVDDDGVMWLKSESRNEEYKEPWRIGKFGDGEGDDRIIRIIGKVLRGVISYA